MGECPCWDDEHFDRGDGVMVCSQCKVAKCSLCEGEGVVARNFAIQSGGTPAIVDCPRCHGEGEEPTNV